MKTTSKYMLYVFNFIIVVAIVLSNYNIVTAQTQQRVGPNDTKTSLAAMAAFVAFNKTVPANGALIDPPANSYMVLQWTDALLPETDQYQYCIDQTNNNSCDGDNWVTRKALFSGGPGDIIFAPNKTYYWQVRARDTGIYANAGAWWSFSTSNVVPAFSKTTPANGSSIPMPASTYYLLQWTDLFLPDTDRYQYCIDQTNNNSCDGDSWVTRNSLFSGSDEFTLEYGKTYYWQVRARDAGTVADGGAWWSFSISGSAPSFGKTTPANGASIPMPDTSYYLLQWTDLFLPITDRYQYCIDTTNNNSCDGNIWVTRNSLYSGGLGDITLEYGKTYYWQVKARDAGTLADGGVWWSFTISGSPPSFGKTTPTNGAVISMPDTTYYLLQWTDLFLPDTDRYQYCIDQTNNNSCDGDNWVTRNSLFSGTDEFTREYGKTYYWQVKARDAGTVADGGAWWSFSIEALAPTPNVLSIVRTTPPDATPIPDQSVIYTITFDQPVSGVDESDFVVVMAGVTGASVTVVNGADNTTTRTITVDTGTGDGTIGLDFADDDSVQNSQGSPIGGVGFGNGNFTGQVYTIDKP